LIQIFISHKKDHSDQAKLIVNALGKIVLPEECFVSEEISKASDFRTEIRSGIIEAKCFVLPYGDPKLDWSWCFYEAGLYAAQRMLGPISKVGTPPDTSEGASRPIYCLCPEGVNPPSPLANLQIINDDPDDIQQWIRNDLCPTLKRRQPSDTDLKTSISLISEALKSLKPAKDILLKPNITVNLIDKVDDWRNIKALPPLIDFSNAIVSFDQASARQLGFGDVPQDQTLISILQQLDDDTDLYTDQHVPIWVERFYDSLLEAVKNKTEFQEVFIFAILTVALQGLS
jgi:hypothetical protein